VIAKAPEKGKRGSDTYGLLGYLFGPGRANEHHDPHLVAAWDPEWLVGGAFADQQRGWLARLGREIDAAMNGHAVDLSGGHVYHVVLSIPQQDGQLGDTVWRELVDEAIERMGFGSDTEGRGGCRWVAVHHGPSKQGNDHVHLVVNLVRGDGRIADTYRDWPRWRQWCLDVERRLGLTATSPANKTAPLRPTRAETEKAVRLHRPESSREFLRHMVRGTASRASSAQEFIALLREARARVEARWDDGGQLIGYKVSVVGDVGRSYQQVWFSGSRLARDLSAPKLVARWASAPAPPPVLPGEPNRMTTGTAERGAAIGDATICIVRARDFISSVAPADSGSDPAAAGIAHSTLDLLVAAANGLEGYNPAGPITAAARTYELAAAMPYRIQPSRWAPVAAELRTASRRIARTGALSRRGSSGVAVAALLLALAGLVAEVAAWRELSGQRQQAIAARHAADFLNADPAVQEHRRSVATHARPTMSLVPADTTTVDRRDQRRVGLERPRIGGFDPVRDPRQRRTR
jgi:hypothetical protein